MKSTIWVLAVIFGKNTRQKCGGARSMAGPKLQKGGGAMAPAAPPVPTPMIWYVYELWYDMMYDIRDGVNNERGK